jgi:hypothetical protein
MDLPIKPEGNIYLNARADEKLELLDSIVAMIFGAAGDGALAPNEALEMVKFVESWRAEVKYHKDNYVDPSHWEMASRN